LAQAEAVRAVERPLGVYVHFPWCRKRCPYCDFAIAIAPMDEVPHERYRDAVLAELDERADSFADRRPVSIYFGGGTPGLWQPDCIASVIGGVRERFDGGDLREITLEVNPTDCRPEALGAWLGAGVNRLSIGVQSFEPAELVTLGRDHRFGDGAAAVEAARAAGVERISLDVILGTPAGGHGQSSVARAADLAPDHLSVYELTIEERTPFGAAARRGELVPLEDDELAALYLGADAELAARGYEHYEVSSYARPGCRAVHNSLYWSGDEFLGLGNGAASFRRTDDGGGERLTNVRSAASYLSSSGGDRVAEVLSSSPRQLAEERLWLAMRASDGAPSEAFAGRGDLLERLVADGLVDSRDGRVRPTIRGFLYNDLIARRVAMAPAPGVVTE